LVVDTQISATLKTTRAWNNVVLDWPATGVILQLAALILQCLNNLSPRVYPVIPDGKL